MAILDVKLSTRGGTKTSVVKIIYNELDSFRSTVVQALKKYLEREHEDHDDAAAEDTLQRIVTIRCNKTKTHNDLLEWLGEEEVCVGDLHSLETPIMKSGLDITLEPKREARSSLTAPRRRKKIGNVGDVLMRRTLLPVKYLTSEVEINSDLNLQEQLKVGLVKLMKDDLNLGFCDGKQKDQLTTNLGHLNNILCFFEKHWKVLLRKEFPELPKGLESSPLLDMLSTVKRLSEKK